MVTCNILGFGCENHQGVTRLGDAMVTPGFTARLHKAQRMFLREMRDGCVDCMTLKWGYCKVHNKVAYDVILSPRKMPEFQKFLEETVK